MKRYKDGAVEFVWKDRRVRLSNEDGISVWVDVFWDIPQQNDWYLWFIDEDFRTLLIEAIQLFDHPYDSININIPEQHRATPKGNK